MANHRNQLMVTAMTTQNAGNSRQRHKMDMPEAPALRAHPEPLAYRIADACYTLGIGRTSLYELVKTGELKLIKIAGRTLVPRSEIERLTSVDRAA